jgi:parallel beta-helix repeat protein
LNGCDNRVFSLSSERIWSFFLRNEALLAVFLKNRGQSRARKNGKLGFRGNAKSRVARTHHVAKTLHLPTFYVHTFHHDAMQLRNLLLVVLLTTGRTANSEQTIHVATHGDDAAIGSVDAPLATIAGARNRIRSLKQDPDYRLDAIEVLIHAGRYPQLDTMEWTEEDSGTEQAPITYRSVDGKVVVTGGQMIDVWQPLTNADLLNRLPIAAHGKVLCADLKQLQIQPGNLVSRRLHQSVQPEPMELFVNNQRLPLASWPNHDWAQIQRNENPNLPRSWSLQRNIHPQDFEHAWAHGFWTHDWQDSFEPVMVDSNSKTISLTATETNSPSSIRNGARYKLCNVLSELDIPGEWYVDTTTELLVYWPTESSDSSAAVTASTVETLLSLYDVEHVNFEGLTIETARAMLVEIVGGSNVRFQGCTLTQAGNVAVHVFRGEQHQLIECDISCTGSSAIRIEAGDRATLTSANHCVEDCHVHRFGQHFMAGRPGISIYGVGTKLLRNYIHHGPDSAIGIHGNEHTIEQNEISHVCTQADDSGAIHLSYDPTYRGNAIRKNFVHDLGGFSKTGVIGIYLDDFASGTIVESNYLLNTVRGIAIGGGRDNRLENNVIHGALAAIQIDARGTTWSKSEIQGENSRIQQLCRQTCAESPIFAKRYPELEQMLQDQPELPKGNIVRANTFQSTIGIDLQQVSPTYVVLAGNIKQDATANNDTEGILAQLGIQQIPLGLPASARTSRLP